MADNVKDLLGGLLETIPPAPQKAEPSKKAFIQSPKEEEGKQEATPQEDPPPAPPAPPASDEVLELVRAQNAQIQQLMQTVQTLQEGGQRPPAENPPQIDPAALVKAEDMEGLVNEDGMIDTTKLANLIATVGTRSYQLAREHTMRDIPEIVSKTAQREAAYAGTIGSFWQANPDLQPFQQDVKAEADQVLAANPSYTLHQVLDAAAKNVRKKLKAYTEAAGLMQGGTPSPNNFPQGGSGGQRPNGEDNRTDLQKGIADLLKGVQPGQHFVR